jgi:hypothetical protein
MRSARGIRPLATRAGVFVAGLVLGGALSSWASTPTQLNIREGDTLASFFPNDVMALTYATPSGTTTVQRSTPGARFDVLSTFPNDRPAQRCTSSADLEGHLENLTTLTAHRGISLEQREREFPVQLGVIALQDTVIGEPPDPILVFANKDRTAIAVIVEGSAAEVTLKGEDLQWLEQTCAEAPDFHPLGLRR